MSDHHLTAFEQQEYVLGEPAAETLGHLSRCAQCQAAVSRLQQGLSAFRTVAVAWSDASLATRPQTIPRVRERPLPALRWAAAGLMPIFLLLLALFAFHSPHQSAVRPAVAISDDALLEQVDDQLSVAVPSSMESLTHLVSAENNHESEPGSRQRAQTN